MRPNQTGRLIGWTVWFVSQKTFYTQSDTVPDVQRMCFLDADFFFFCLSLKIVGKAAKKKKRKLLRRKKLMVTLKQILENIVFFPFCFVICLWYLVLVISHYPLVLKKSLSRVVWSCLGGGYANSLFPITVDWFNADLLRVCGSAVFQEAAVLIAPLVADCLGSLLGQSHCLQETLSSRLSPLIKSTRRPSMQFKDRGSPSRRCEVVGAGFTRSTTYSVMWAGGYLLINTSCQRAAQSTTLHF